MQRLSLVAAPAADPVSVSEARAHARLSPDLQDDPDITLKLQAAIADRQSFTQRQFITATWRLALCAFCARIMLDLPPLQSVVSVKYYDTANVLQTVDPSNYNVHVPSGDRAAAGWIEFVFGYSLPITYDRDDAVLVEFKAGYGDVAAAVPAPLRSAVLLTFGELYAFREEQATGMVSKNLRSADALCWPYRVIS